MNREHCELQMGIRLASDMRRDVPCFNQRRQAACLMATYEGIFRLRHTLKFSFALLLVGRQRVSLFGISGPNTGACRARTSQVMVLRASPTCVASLSGNVGVPELENPKWRKLPVHEKPNLDPVAKPRALTPIIQLPQSVQPISTRNEGIELCCKLILVMSAHSVVRNTVEACATSPSWVQYHSWMGLTKSRVIREQEVCKYENDWLDKQASNLRTVRELAGRRREAKLRLYPRLTIVHILT